MPRCGISCPHPQITGQVSGQAQVMPRGVTCRWCDQVVLLDLVLTTDPIWCAQPQAFSCPQPFSRGHREES